MFFFLWSCVAPQSTTDTAPHSITCAEVMNSPILPQNMEEMHKLLSQTRALVPELDSVSITLDSIESESTFLAANVDLATAGNPPFERDYRIQINPLLLSDPPSTDGVVAILVHELKHILDYTTMEQNEFLEFALWYAQGDVAIYERETDLFSMERGCAEGLITFREWLYSRISPEALEEKKQNYYTPEEIQAWMAQEQ